jgi:hypothetical protein
MKFKNLSLNNDWKLIEGSVSDVYFNEDLEGVEVVTIDPVSYTTYLYHGKCKEDDLNHDMQILKKLIYNKNEIS